MKKAAAAAPAKAAAKPVVTAKPAVGGKAKQGVVVQSKKPSIVDELKNLSTGWADAEVMEGFGDLPEGKYVVVIDDININHAKAESNRLQASWTMTVAEGDYVNRKVWKHDGLEDPAKLGFLRTSLHRLGVEWPAGPEGLPETFESMKGICAEITVKQKGEFLNVYINKAVDPSEIGTNELPAEEGVEETTEEAPAEEETTEEVVEEEAAAEEEVVEDEATAPTLKTAKILLPGQVKEMLALAKTAAFSTGDSKKPLEYVVQLGEYCGLTGEFTNASELLEQIKATLA